MKKIALLGVLLISLNAAVLDSDLDGVPDTQDMCPNTPFLDTVNKYGCSQSQLIKKDKIKFNISAGYEYDHYSSSDDSLLLTSIMAYNKTFSLSYYYSMQDSKSNDSILSLYYKHFISSNTKIKVGLKTYFATSYNSQTDYALKLKATYYSSSWAFSLSEKHKIYGESGTNDKDTITVEAGKMIKKFYVSPYMYTENSAYDSSDWNSYIGCFTQYSINKKTSVSLDLSKQLDSSSTYSLVTNIGYSF